VTSRVVWAGRYAVFDEIASGGMASVHLACRLGAGETPRVVAIKKLFEQFAKQPEFVTMFLDEAHIAARIRHPNVVTTYEFLRVPDSLAIVMELVLGISLLDLSRIARERQRIAEVSVSATILNGALQGLHAAHELTDEGGAAVGLVHRDVSPHNILVGIDGSSRVIDFGIAKASGRLQVTEVGIMKGKFAYMAPEQIRAGAIDRRVDIYSSGIVLWEALTGRSLFRGSADAEHFSKRGAGAVTASPPSEVNAAVPPELDAVVARALAVDPEARFATALEMANALSAAVELATSAQVAAWAEGLAGSRMRSLVARRDAVEASFASGELSGLLAATAPSSSLASSTHVEEPKPAAAYPSPALDIPDLLPANKSPNVPKSRARASSPAARAPRSFTSGPALDDVFHGASAADLDLDLVFGDHVRAPSASGMIDARGQAQAGHAGPSRVTARRPRRGAGLVVLVVLATLVAGAAAYLGPTFVKSALVLAAARRGMTITFEGIEPRVGGLCLSGVTFALANVEGVTGKAPTVDLGLDWTGSVRSVVAQGYELRVRGDGRDVAASLSAWRETPRLPIAFVATAGHLRWVDALAPGTDLDGLDVTTTLGTTAEGALHVSVPSLTVTLPRAPLGPWRAEFDSTEVLTSLAIALDRARPTEAPMLRLVVQPAVGSTLSATIPRSKGAQIGVPAELLPAGTEPEFDLVFEGHLRPTGELATAHARLGLFAVSTSSGAPSSPAVDLVFEGSVGGEGPVRPIQNGSLAVGAVRSRMSGQVTIERGRVGVEVERPGHSGHPLVFDTHDWTQRKPEDDAPPTPTAEPGTRPAPPTRP